jgi:sec-independent protein translocase protein TatB
MFNLDPGKLLILAVVAVILLGPDRLPQVARQAGAAWKTFNDFRHRMEAEVRNQVPDLPSSAEIAGMVRSPTALLNKLSTLGDSDAKTPPPGTAAATNGANTTIPDGAPIDPSALTNGSATPAPARPPTSHRVPATPSPSSADAVFGDPGLN